MCEIVSKIWEKESSSLRKLNEFDIFIRDNTWIDIIHRLNKIIKKNMRDIVYPLNPFWIPSATRWEKEPFNNSVWIVSSWWFWYVDKKIIAKNEELLNKYKVIVGKVNPDRWGVNNASDWKMNVITKTKIVEPWSVFTESYLLLWVFNTENEAINCANFYKTKIVRYLISLTLSSMNITRENFQFVPQVNFSCPISENDLINEWNLSENEIEAVESIIKPMD